MSEVGICWDCDEPAAGAEGWDWLWEHAKSTGHRIAAWMSI